MSGDTREAVRALRESGLTRAEIAASLGLTPWTVRYHTYALGDRRRDRPLRDYERKVDRQAIVDARLANPAEPITRIARRFGVSHARVHQILAPYGISRRTLPAFRDYPCAGCGRALPTRKSVGRWCDCCERRHYRNGSCPACGLPWNKDRFGRRRPCARCGSTYEAAVACGLVEVGGAA